MGRILCAASPALSVPGYYDLRAVPVVSTQTNVRSLRRTRLPAFLDRAVHLEHRLVDAGAGAGLARLSPDRLAIPPRLRGVRQLRAVAAVHAAGRRARRSPGPRANLSRVASDAGVV